MKKFIITTVSVLAVLCVCIFAACAKTTVSEKEWDKAFEFFDNAKNFSFSINVNERGNTGNIKFDYGKKIIRSDSYDDSGALKSEFYVWQDTEGVVYEYLKTDEFTSKVKLESAFDEFLLTHRIITDIKYSRDKYRSFVYDKAAKSYVRIGGGNGGLFFENGKIKKLTAENSIIEVDYAVPDLTVPEDILGMPLN